MGFKFKGTSRIYEQLRDEQKPKLVYGNPDDPCNVGPEQRQVFPAKVKVTGKRIQSSLRASTTAGSIPNNARTGRDGKEYVYIIPVGSNTGAWHEVNVNRDGNVTSFTNREVPDTTQPFISAAYLDKTLPSTTQIVVDQYTFPVNTDTDACDFGSIYNMNPEVGAPRPLPGITDVQVSVAGQFGMLLTAEVTFNVYSLNDFNRLESIFLRPNNLVDIEISYPYKSTWDMKFKEDSTTAQDFKKLVCNNLVIYKYEFNVKGGASFIIECKFFAMGSANTVGRGFDMYTTVNNLKVPGLNGLSIVNRQGNSVKRNISSIIDVIYYNLFVGNNPEEPAASGLKGRLATKTKLVFDPRNKLPYLGEKLPDTACHAMVVYPNLPQKGILASRRLGWLAEKFTNAEYTGIYITLGYLVNILINKIIVPANKERLLKQFDDANTTTTTNIATPETRTLPSGTNEVGFEFVCTNEFLRAPNYEYLCSGDPMRVVWTNWDGGSSKPPYIKKVGDYGTANAIAEAVSTLAGSNVEIPANSTVTIPIEAVNSTTGEVVAVDINTPGLSLPQTTVIYKNGKWVVTDAAGFDVTYADQTKATRYWLIQNATGGDSSTAGVIGYDFSVDAKRGGDQLVFTRLTGNEAVTNSVDLTKILINVDEIIRIFESVRETEETKPTSERIESTETPAVKLSLESFLKKIFSLIRDASGGFFDIDMIPQHDESGVRIILVNKKFNTIPPNDPLKPIVFENITTDGVTINTNVSMTIPKDAIAMNAYAEASIEGSTASELSENKNLDEYTKHQIAIEDLFYKRVFVFADSEANETGVDPLKSAVREFINTVPKEVVRKDGVIPYPLNIDLTVDGINGFEFGDLINLSIIPQLSGYKNTVFRVLNVTHTVDANNKWTTNLKTVCDLNPNGGSLYGDVIKDATPASAASQTRQSISGWTPGYPSWIPLNNTVQGKISSLPQANRSINGITRAHEGIDVGVGIGSEIVAPADGVVFIRAGNGSLGNNSGDGNLGNKQYMVLVDKNRNWHIFGHGRSAAVANDTYVTRGQVIGTTGTAGTGPHLHYEIWYDGNSGNNIDPVGWLNNNYTNKPSNAKLIDQTTGRLK